MIELSSVTKSYANHMALKQVDLFIQEGEIFGIIGKSGAGKSTLLRTLNRLEQPNQGEVIIDGENITHLKSRDLRHIRHKIAMIFQHFNLLNSSTVYENIALPLECSGVSKDQIKERVTYLLEVTGLSDKKDQYPGQLSGGQKQRVAIARAIATNPKVLLCDEATSALDSETTISILNLLKEINQKFAVTIVLITHEKEVVNHLHGRVVLIENGELKEQ